MQDRRLITSAIWCAGARTAVAAAVVAGWAAAPIGAQYTSPGSVATTSGVPSKEALDESVNSSPWKLGAVCFSPWLGLRDASFVTSRGISERAEDPEGDPDPQQQRQPSSDTDFTVTAGAGLRAYLPTGKVFFAAHALPEYVWWQDDENKRSFNGRYGLGVFGYFNRLTLGVSQRLNQQQDFFSSEIQELTSSRNDISQLNLELEAVRHLVIYGTAARLELSNQEDENETFSRLDREQEAFTVGLRYRSPRGWTLGLGFEDTTTDFGAEARRLSNSGSSQLVELGLEGSRVSFRLALALRDLEGDEGSDFGTFNETTGNLEVLWDLSPRLPLLTYARRSQTFSVDQRNAFSIEERQGARLGVNFNRLSFGLLAEVGEDEFAAVSTGTVDRRDDVTAFGASLGFRFGKLVSLSMQATHTRSDSTFEEFDREVTDVGFAIQLRAPTEKLRLGQPGGDW